MQACSQVSGMLPCWSLTQGSLQALTWRTNLLLSVTAFDRPFRSQTGFKAHTLHIMQCGRTSKYHAHTTNPWTVHTLEKFYILTAPHILPLLLPAAAPTHNHTGHWWSEADMSYMTYKLFLNIGAVFGGVRMPWNKNYDKVRVDSLLIHGVCTVWVCFCGTAGCVCMRRLG